MGARGRVAVLGATGQLGSDLVTILRSGEEFEVDAYSRERLDVTDAVAVEEAIEPGRYDAVINCAALTNVDYCEEHGEQALAVNAGGAYLVARACREAGSRHVLIGTDFVFDGEKEVAYHEFDTPRPLNVYGMSKLCGETMAGHEAPESLVIRISSVFGVAGARGKGGNFIETILAKAAAGERLRVVEDITMSPTYTVDVARAIPALLKAKITGVVHLANSGSCSWYEFALDALRLCGLEAEIEPVSAVDFPRAARRPRNSSLTSRRVAGVGGAEMRHWREALRAYLEEKGRLAFEGKDIR